MSEPPSSEDLDPYPATTRPTPPTTPTPSNAKSHIISGDNKADDLAAGFSTNSSGNNALLYAFIAAAVVLIIALAVLLALRSRKKKHPGPPVGPQFGYGPNF